MTANSKQIKRNFILVLSLVFVFPIGIFLLWRWRVWNRYVNIGISLLILFLSRHIFVLYMIFYGYFIYPEASSILFHYCFGDGSTLTLRNDYFQRSPVILYQLKKMKRGEKRKIRMHQLEDLRLSYALNPFTIEKYSDSVVISQYIKFSRRGDVITWVGPIPVPDNIVHVFDCTPFLLKSSFPWYEHQRIDQKDPNIFESYFLKHHLPCKDCSRNNYSVLK